jgi:pimeloyl-ACP methyl ester carboxylesterase
MIMWGSGSPRRAPRSADRAMAPVHRGVITHRIRALLTVDVSERLGEIRAPVLILSATRDQIIRSDATAGIASRLPEAEHVQLEGPHLLLQAKPAECARQVLKFIEKCSAAGG